VECDKNYYVAIKYRDALTWHTPTAHLALVLHCALKLC